jgi:putative FmdB family regulatory protein
MPIYEYECNQCGKPFEKIVRFSEADQIPACPKCESKDTHKKISAVFGSDKYIQQWLWFARGVYLRWITPIRPCVGFLSWKYKFVCGIDLLWVP